MEDISTKLKRLVKESEKELIDIGLGHKLKKDINYTINYRAKKRFGQCCGKKDINISSWLLEIGTDKDIKNTIIHEILHTFEDTIGHKAKWKYYANYVNNRTDYNIERTGSIYETYYNAKIIFREKEVYNYKITCKKCGGIIYRQRLSKKSKLYFERGCMRHTTCGGKDFVIEKI